MAVLRVLLTNDDGIDAEGLQALRRALVALDDIQLAVDRAGRQPLGDGALDHVPAPAVGGRGAVRRRHRRLRLRRHAGRLRAAGRARPDRGLRARPDRLGHQPRRQPRRRHHLLGHGRRRAGGRSCSASRGSPSRSSPTGARWTSGSGTVRLRATPPRSSRRVVDRLDDVPLPPGTLLNINVPAGEIGGVEVARLGKRDLPGPARPDRGGHRPQALPRLRRRAAARRRAGHRPRGGRRGPDRGHAAALRPDRRARHGGAARRTTSRSCWARK